MCKNVVKILHRSSSEARHHGDAIRTEPGFIDLIERILDKGLVFDAADRMLLARGCRSRILVEHPAERT